MRKKLKNTARRLRDFKLFFILFFIIPLALSGCAKTGYPTPPQTTMPAPPHMLTAKKSDGGISIFYEYRGNIKSVKGFFLYSRFFKTKKEMTSLCGGMAPFAFQNLEFKKKFSAGNGAFFYKFKKEDLKKGYYIFCSKAVDGYGVKSSFSNHIIVHVMP